MSTRRWFLMGAGATVASRVAFGTDKIRVAVLGVHGRGRDHIKGFMGLKDAEVVCLCDPDQKVLDDRARSFESGHGRKVDAVTDLRRVFDRKDIDAVSIATPNHWHALATIWACQAGKDVYVEKPGSHNIREGRKMVEAARKYNRIVQHGVQLRSSEALQEGVSLLNKGTIGQVYMARALIYRWRPDIGRKENEAVPANLNYDIWQGPAQERPFNPNIVHYNWHWNWNYGNGDLGNQGIHETDMCLWGLGVGLPTRVSAMGGKFLFDDDKETPEVLTGACHYPEQKKMIEIEVRHWCTNEERGVGVGNIFYGKDGYMVVKGYDSFETYLGKHRESGPKRKAGGNHFANFIKAVRSRNVADQNAPVNTAHLSSGIAHLCNISLRVGRQLQFDPEAERFIGDEQANELLTRKYRAPYVVPDQV